MTTKTRDLELIAPPPAPEPDAVTLARSEAQKLYAMEAAHADRGMQARKDEQNLSTSAGVLDLASFESASTVDLARRLSEIHAIALLADRAVDLCRQKRRETLISLRAAETAALRSRAAALIAEADRHAAKTATLLDALQQHEGCAFAPVGPPGYAPGVYADPVAYPQPKSAALRFQAQAAEAQAQQRERQPILDRGALTVGAIEPVQEIGPQGQPLTVEKQLADATGADLYAQIQALGPYVIAPTIASVYHWLTDGLAAAEQKRQRGMGDIRRSKIRIHLVWCDGVIDTAQSRISLIADE